MQGPGGHVSREEYLLGRKVDASLDLLNREENKESEQKPKSSHIIEYGELALFKLLLEALSTLQGFFDFIAQIKKINIELYLGFAQESFCFQN